MTPHFAKTEDGGLIELEEEQLTETAGLQKWIAEYPALLAGGEIEPDDPRRFLLIRREAPIEGLKLDHLFVDQDAIPTFVEAKKADNREARRLVVAQMLDYASEASAGWTGEGVKAWFEGRCLEAKLDPQEQFAALDPDPADSEAFWQRVEENLRAGQIRLIFACDTIPTSLQRIIEFLNERMDPTVVLALEVRRLESEGQEMFHSRLVGATERARAIKGKSRKASVVPILIEADILKDGMELWLLPSVLPAAVRPAPDDTRLRLTLKVDGGAATVLWDPLGEGATELSASRAPSAIRQLLDQSYTSDRARAVHDALALEPGGPSLGELAEEAGVWDAA